MQRMYRVARLGRLGEAGRRRQAPCAPGAMLRSAAAALKLQMREGPARREQLLQAVRGGVRVQALHEDVAAAEGDKTEARVHGQWQGARRARVRGVGVARAVLGAADGRVGGPGWRLVWRHGGRARRDEEDDRRMVGCAVGVHEGGLLSRAVWEAAGREAGWLAGAVSRCLGVG